jgi:hypothetical protein
LAEVIGVWQAGVAFGADDRGGVYGIGLAVRVLGQQAKNRNKGQPSHRKLSEFELNQLN